MTTQNSERYTIGQLAELAGVSTRTLRYYEELGLLRPKRTLTGYRVFDTHDAKQLAHIVAMRSCGLSLTTIRQILNEPEADLHSALTTHLYDLRTQARSLDDAIGRTEQAIAAIEGMKHMNAQDSFNEMKAQGLKHFEETYGAEARERYGDNAINEANERMMALSRDEWDDKELLEEAIKKQLRTALAEGDIESETARELAAMHQRWIRIHWGESYSPEAHRNLANMYVTDERFVDYYDSAAGPGATEFLAQVIAAHI